ncbi:MAG: hypothetical protein ACFFC3_11920 [Candidatus Odinarchaeota archaeon]
MIRTFIFNEDKSQWLEEENTLLAHDICIILDEENQIIYFWSGPKSNKEKIRRGYKKIKELISNFSNLNLQLIMTESNFPLDIQNKVNLLLESVKSGDESILRFSRFTTIRIYSISIIISIFLPILLFIFLSSSLTWKISNGTYEVQSSVYDFWIDTSWLINLITLFFFSLNLIIGIIEYEKQVIIFSLNGLILSIGVLIYLNQGIFLFLFQEGSTLTIYYILQQDIIIFLLIILIAILIYEIPNIYKLITFFKTYRKFIF